MIDAAWPRYLDEDRLDLPATRRRGPSRGRRPRRGRFAGGVDVGSERIDRATP
jgi:hypothetical protein